MARRSTLRASDADREGVIDRLREAAAEGRLAAHELEQRIADALGARTYGDLDATVSDLPSSPEPRRRPQRSRAGRSAVAAVRDHPALLLVAIPVVMVVVAAMIAVALVWAAVTILALVLGHRRAVMHRVAAPRIGPWRYGNQPARRSGSWM